MDSEPRLVSSAQCPAPSLQPAGWEASCSSRLGNGPHRLQGTSPVRTAPERCCGSQTEEEAEEAAGRVQGADRPGSAPPVFGGTHGAR